MALKTFTCEHCDKEFQDKDCRNRKYCSKTCTNAAKKGTQWGNGPIERNCEHCDKPFRRRYRTDKVQRFCSPECMGKAKAKRTFARQCKQCKQSFVVPYPQRHRQFCSPDCYHTWNSGNNHVLHVGDRDDYYGPNWYSQRREARKRDGYCCQHCGVSEKKSGRELDVHHIVPFRTFGKDYWSANQLPNLISLCRKCHKLAEHERIPIQPSLI